MCKKMYIYILRIQIVDHDLYIVPTQKSSLTVIYYGNFEFK